mgnify:CR=1 FL=1
MKILSKTATINFGTDAFFLAEGKILFHTVATDLKIIVRTDFNQFIWQMVRIREGGITYL